jgi:AcrR family transcriptional regulator
MDGVNMSSNSTSNTSTYHHGNLRQELIAAALLLLDDEGIEGVGVRQIARKVGVAHSAPANHFKNKRALFTALATEIFRDLLKSLKTRCQRRPTLRESIHDFCEAMLAFGLQYPNRYMVMWRRDCSDSNDPELNAAMEAVYQELLAILSAQVKQKEVDLESQAIALWSLIHGYTSLRLDGNLSTGQDSVAGISRSSAIIEVMLDGLI